MGYQKYLKEILRKRPKNIILLNIQRKIVWRKEPSIFRIEYPTNPLAARAKGYRAKQGIILVRVRVKRGGKRHPSSGVRGRTSKASSLKLVLGKNYQWVAEERTQKYYKNLEVLNSYKVGKDAIYAWYEVILIDPHHPGIKSSKELNWICSNKHSYRVLRGKTSACRKSRGLGGKGQGYEKARPSSRANLRRIK